MTYGLYDDEKGLRVVDSGMCRRHLSLVTLLMMDISTLEASSDLSSYRLDIVATGKIDLIPYWL